MKESNIQSAIMLALSESGVLIFRNNVGALKDKTGRIVRYGVCNPGGSDLIGATPVIITEEMVGQTLAVFTAIEVKTATGRASEAQTLFIEAVRRHGGRAGIARSPQDAVRIAIPAP